MIFDNTNIPSRMLPYPVKQIEVVPFRPAQMQMLSKSVMLNDMQPAIDALGQVMTNLDINELTAGDFFYLLAWQRFNALKRPVMANWVCNGAMFADRQDGTRYSTRDIRTLVHNWEDADDTTRQELRDPNDVVLDGYTCSHQNYQQLAFSEFEHVYLPEDTVLDERLDHPRCDTLAEFTKLQRDPDYGMLAEAGRWLKGKGTLLHRIQKLVASEDTELLEAAMEAARDIQHGTRKIVMKKCEHCGHAHAMSFTMDPQAFFL